MKTGLNTHGWIFIVIAVALVVAACSGCHHIPPGGATESNTSFGIPGVFSIKNETKNVKVTEKQIKVGDTSDEVQILLFTLTHSAKGVYLTNPPREPEKP